MQKCKCVSPNHNHQATCSKDTTREDGYCLECSDKISKETADANQDSTGGLPPRSR